MNIARSVAGWLKSRFPASYKVLSSELKVHDGNAEPVGASSDEIMGMVGNNTEIVEERHHPQD